MSFPEIVRASLPVLTTNQMIEVDRAMIEDYGIALVQMMENAGRALALLSRDAFLGGAPAGRRVLVMAGTGGNGGGAMVAARRLATWGADVTLCLSNSPEDLSGVPAQQLTILRAMGIPMTMNPPVTRHAAVILDGLIGYNLRGAPRGLAADLISWANEQPAPVLSLDAPSGLDATTGTAHHPSISATATLTLALPKTGLGHPQVGALYLADISVPPDLYRRFLDLDIGQIFGKSDIVQLV